MKASSWVSTIVLMAIGCIVGLALLESSLQSNRVDVLVRNSSGEVVREVRISEYGKPLLEVSELKVGMVRRCSYRAETDGGVDLYYLGEDGESVRVEGSYTTGGSHGTLEFTFQADGTVFVDPSGLSLVGFW